MTINALYEAVQRGEPDAERALFAKLSERFLYFVQHKVGDPDLCHDIVQEALITVARKYLEVTFESNFAGWAHNVVLNKVMESYRRGKRDNERFIRLPDDIEVAVAEHGADPLLESMLVECLQRVNSANNRQARILNLKYQGFTTEEIAVRMKMTRNAIYMTLSRARTLLKECLDERMR